MCVLFATRCALWAWLIRSRPQHLPGNMGKQQLIAAAATATGRAQSRIRPFGERIAFMFDTAPKHIAQTGRKQERQNSQTDSEHTKNEQK